VKATLEALAELRDRDDVVKMRGTPTEEAPAPAD